MKRPYLICAASAVARRELRHSFYGLGLYTVLTVCFLISFYIARSYADSMLQGGVAISKCPLEYPAYLTTTILALYLALCASISVSRERDQGTLEVLFCGPMNHGSYLMARFSEQIVLFCIALCCVTVYFTVMSLVSGLELGLRFWSTIAGSVLLASYTSAFGLLVSVLSKNPRTATAVFLLVNLILIGIRTAASVLSGTSNEVLSASVIYLKLATVVADRALRWVSPFSYCTWLTDAVELGDVRIVAIIVAAAVIYTALLLSLATKALQRRGVRTGQ
ncbi:MAG: ABC transporter permease subunit [Clostridiaceae bacterium]|nr:ABC transporter permease subunit [Clostridiaceae bacterium]